MQQRSIHLTVEIAIFTALTIVLDQISLFRMPQGGTISLGMLPIIIIALRHGTLAGVTTGALTGIVNFLFGGYFLNLVQIILDYPMAFAAMGLVGIYANKFQTQLNHNHLRRAAWLASGGMLVGALSVWIVHILSGVFFFAQFAPPGQPIWFYSAWYNASYVIPKMTLTLFVLLLLIYKAPRILRPNI